MFCDKCGYTWNPDHRSSMCPHPLINSGDPLISIERFNYHDKSAFPLSLGVDYADVDRLIGSVSLTGRGRAFFNNLNPLPLQLCMSAFKTGEVLIPVEFVITHPPIHPVFGDFR